MFKKRKLYVQIAYVSNEENPTTYLTIQVEKILLSNCYKKKDNNAELTKKEIIKLHHFFGHCTAQRLENLIQKEDITKDYHTKSVQFQSVGFFRFEI